MKNSLISSELQKQIVVLVISLLLSVIIGFVPDWTGIAFTTADQLTLSIGSFSAFLIIDVLWVVSAHAERSAKEHSIWAIRNEGELLLANIRANFFSIVRDSFSAKDLFVIYFMEEFEQLAHRIKDAAETQNLRVTSNHLFVTTGLFEPSTYGGDDLIIRYTWPLTGKELLFEDYPWKRYFEQLTLNAKLGKIDSIKTIFIVDNLKLLETPRIKLFLDFFNTNKGFVCRVMKTDDYKNMCVQNSIPLSYIDFGIYGKTLLFRTEQNAPDTTGLFTKDLATIRTYITFFEILWSSAGITKPNPSTCSKQVTLEELFDFDNNNPLES